MQKLNLMVGEDLSFHLAFFFHNLGLLMSTKNWGVSKVLHLPGNLVCTGLQSNGFTSIFSVTLPDLYWHPGDVEAKGKEAFFAL